MDCADVNAYFVKESGRLTGEIARKGRIASPWLAMLEKDFFPDEHGHTLTRVIYERTVPTVGEGAGWTNVTGSTTSSGGTSKSCRPTAATLSSRSQTKSATLAEFVLDSDEICINDVRASYRYREQISEIKRNFEKTVNELWEERHRAQYMAAIPAVNKLVFASGSLVPGSSGDFDGSAPDSQIHQDALDAVRWKLIRDGAAEEGAYAMSEGAPVFVAIMSGEQQRALIKGNASVREDYREADPKALLKPFGIKRSYSGYFHVIDDKAARWNLTEGGDWEEVPFWTVTSGVASPNPDYDDALYEDIVIFHPKVVKCLMQKPLSSVGADTSFKPWDYSGEILWINEYDKVCNKYMDTGYWSARLRAAYQPLVPQYGYAIRVLRCPNGLGTTPCPEGPTS